MASLVGPGQYALSILNRGMYGSPITAHNAGAQFARIDSALFRLPFTQDRIGQKLLLKFSSVNLYNAAPQSLSDPSVVEYSYVIQGTALSSPLPVVENLVWNYTGNQAQLSWQQVSDFRPVSYEVRQGTSAQGAQVLGRVAAPPFIIPGDGTFWVAAVSQPVPGLTVYSSQWSEITVGQSTVQRNIVANYEEDPSWSGTCSGEAAVSGSTVVVNSGNFLGISNFLAQADLLLLGSFVGTGTYTIPAGHVVDVQRVAPCLVTIGVSGIGQQQPTTGFLSVADFLGTTDLIGGAASVNIDLVPQIGTSNDDITWNWQDYVPGIYVARYFSARVGITSYDTQTEAILESMSFTVDAPDRTDDYVGISIAAGGTAISYTPNGSVTAAPFNGGPGGAALPNVVVQILGMVAGDVISITAQSLSGCTVQILNGGVGVARTCNIIVKGY
jgi:hypothetical protein